MTSRVPNNRKPVITPQKPSYAGARGMTRREQYDHIQSFQHVAPKTSGTATTGTNTAVATTGDTGAPAAPSSSVPLSNFAPFDLTVGDAGNPGAGTQASRYDHVHAMPAVFGPAGASHSTGFVPDPGITAHTTTPYYLGDDGNYHQLTQGQNISLTWAGGGTGALTLLANLWFHAITTVTGTYTALSTDEVILADATGGAFTVTLPTPVGITGRGYTVKRLNAGVNVVTVGTAAGLIDGLATQPLATQYLPLRVVSDGSNWYTV